MPQTANGKPCISVMPVQWTELQDIDDVEPVNARDAACLAEVRDVLKRHGRANRFGVALLHRHGQLRPDEVMLETSDDSSRALTLRPAQKSDVPEGAVGTIWMLNSEEPAPLVMCQKTIFGGHVPLGED